MGLPTNYLSVSQLNTYLTCPRKYYFSYVEKLPQTKSSALAVGSAFHKSIEVVNQKKMYLEEIPSESEIEEIYNESFDKSAKEVEFKEDESPEEEKERGLKLVHAYLKSDIAEETLPLALEMRFDIDVLGIPFVGYIDMVEVDGSIRDLKTSRKTPSKDTADKSLQLTAYSFAWRYLTGEYESGISLDYAISLKKEPKILRLETTMTDERIDRFKEVVYQLAVAIDNKLYYRNEGQNCSWCSYKDVCLGGGC